MNKCELLAPAGGVAALTAAVQAGADAVYLGGDLFSARALAQNFNREQLKEAVDYCHLRCVKVYVAVNTLVSQREMQQLEQYLYFLHDVGVDAIIVQDLGVAQVAKAIVPRLPIHASTQMTVYDADGAAFLKQHGFSRVVLARELSAKQIEAICNAVPIEVEVFVHGAICVCYSGQCLMSSMIGGRSGNRGNCAQPCRLPYSLGKTSGALLSPKDLCLLPHLEELRQMGVASLKIEGRMKGPEYVETVVGIYRRYLDAPAPLRKEDTDALNSVFYRGGLTDGYYTGKTGREQFCYDKPDNPYLRQGKTATYQTIERKRPIAFHVSLEAERPVVATAECDGTYVSVTGERPAEHAIKQPITEERVRAQFMKLGGTVFCFGDCDVSIVGGATVPLSELNDIRRRLVQQMEQALAASARRTTKAQKTLERPQDKPSLPFSIVAQVSTKEQLEALRQAGCDQLYVPVSFAQQGDVAVLPRICTSDWKGQLEQSGCTKALAGNVGQLQPLASMQVECYTDTSFNVFNEQALLFLQQCGASRISVSCELMLSQIRDLRKPVPLEAVIYGHLPLMITQHCIVRAAAGCQQGGVLKDRMGKEFFVRCAEGCRSEVLNGTPLVMSDRMQDIRQAGLSFGRLLFTVESPERCVEIYRAYQAETACQNEFTRGKFYKGV